MLLKMRSIHAICNRRRLQVSTAIFEMYLGYIFCTVGICQSEISTGISNVESPENEASTTS